jgi:hypothetical protein
MSLRFQGSAKIFARKLKDFADLSDDRLRMVFLRSAREALRSIKFGSEITGAPGQPVKTRKLLNSWRISGTAASGTITIETPIHYASIIEHNFRGATLRSKVGGWHSVKITRLNFRYIVAHELKQVKLDLPDR